MSARPPTCSLPRRIERASTGGTVELLKQNAVVGVKATFDGEGNLTRIGITRAFFIPLGLRLDGAYNRIGASDEVPSVGGT